MSAPAEVALPCTWRPRKTRRMCRSISAALLVVFGGLALLLPSGGGLSFSIGDRLGVVACAVAISWFLNLHASVRVVADSDGLLVANLFRKQRLAWGEVIAVRFRPGDPWAFADVADGQTLALMGIQASDGPAAAVAARDLARLVQHRSSAHGDRAATEAG
jgi:hypothetical protein